MNWLNEKYMQLCSNSRKLIYYMVYHDLPYKSAKISRNLVKVFYKGVDSYKVQCICNGFCILSMCVCMFKIINALHIYILYSITACELSVILIFINGINHYIEYITTYEAINSTVSGLSSADSDSDTDDSASDDAGYLSDD